MIMPGRSWVAGIAIAGLHLLLSCRKFSAAGQDAGVEVAGASAARGSNTYFTQPPGARPNVASQNESKIEWFIEEVHMRIGRYESSAGAVGTSVAFLFIGLGVGAALGLLLAPKSGRQMRKDLRRSYEDALETISDWSDEAKDRFDEAVEKGADFADELRAKAEPLTDLLRRP